VHAGGALIIASASPSGAAVGVASTAVNALGHNTASTWWIDNANCE
jgi:hypothetical protein